MSFTQQDKNQLISELKQALQAVEKMPVTKNCATCANYDYKNTPPTCIPAGCAPPADVILQGCEGYIFDHTKPPF